MTVIARDEFLERQLILVAGRQGVRHDLAAVSEDPRLASAAEQLQVNGRVVPVQLDLGLYQHGTCGVAQGVRATVVPGECPRHGETAVPREGLEAVLVDERTANVRVVEQQEEALREVVAKRMD